MTQSKAVFAAAVLAPALFCATPSRATETVSCEALDDSGVTIEVNLGLVAVEQPIWIRVDIGEGLWSSLDQDVVDNPDVLPVVIAQSLIDDTSLAIDVADQNLVSKLASIRVARLEEGEDTFNFGHVQLHGRSVHPITCDGT